MLAPGIFTNYTKPTIITTPKPEPAVPPPPPPPVVTPPVENAPEFKFRTAISLNPDGSNKISRFQNGFIYKGYGDKLTKLKEKHGYTGGNRVFPDRLPIPEVSRGTDIEDPTSKFYLWLEFDTLEDSEVTVTTESYYLLESQNSSSLGGRPKRTIVPEELRSYKINFTPKYSTPFFYAPMGTTDDYFGNPIVFASPYFRVSDDTFNRTFTKFNYNNVNSTIGVSNIPVALQENGYKQKLTKKLLIGRFDGRCNNVLPLQVLIKTTVGNKTEYHVVTIPGSVSEGTILYKNFFIDNEINASMTSKKVYLNVPEDTPGEDYLFVFKQPKGIRINSIIDSGKQVANQRQNVVEGSFSYLNTTQSESGDLWHMRMMKKGRQLLMDIPFQQIVTPNRTFNPTWVMDYLNNENRVSIIDHHFALGIYNTIR